MAFDSRRGGGASMRTEAARASRAAIADGGCASEVDILVKRVGDG